MEEALLRTVAFLAHIDAGKTTTTERVLFYSGVIRRLGEVDNGTAQMDWMAQEQERGISITAAVTFCPWRGGEIQIIDTPGHVDFSVEVERSLWVLDGAVVILSAVEGVEPQTESVWHQAERFGVPRIVFINKMDRVGADFRRCVVELEERLGAWPVLMQLPWGEEEALAGLVDLVDQVALSFDPAAQGTLVRRSALPEQLVDLAAEAREELVARLAEVDDQVADLYLQDRPVEGPFLRASLRRAVLEGRAVPVFLGAARRNLGVQPMMDGIVDYLPSPPARLAPLRGTVVQVFKVQRHPYMGHLHYMKVASGQIKAGDRLICSRTGREVVLGGLFRMHADEPRPVSLLGWGRIGAAMDLGEVRTGDVLVDRERHQPLPTLHLPSPVVEATLEPEREEEWDRFIQALRWMSLEDPSLTVRQDGETGQILIAGMGELHLEVAVERLKREYGVSGRVGRPQVAYREGIGGVGRARDTSERVLPKRVMAWVEVEVSPGEAEVLLLSPLPEAYAGAVEAGLAEVMEGGAVSGSPLHRVRVRAWAGQVEGVGADEAAFRLAAARAMRQALIKAGPTLLEPWAKLEVAVPFSSMGEVVGHIQARRGHVEAVEARGVRVHIRAEVPLAETFGYATALRSATKGRGVFNLEFTRYAPVPLVGQEGLPAGLA